MKQGRLLLLISLLASVLSLLVLSPVYAQDVTPVPTTDKLERTRALMAEGGGASSTTSWKPGTEGDLSATGTGMMKGLVSCLAMLLIGAAIYKKYFLKNAPVAGRRISIIEKTPLTHRSMLALVEVDGRRILVSSGVECVSFIDLDAETNIKKGKVQFEDTLRAASVKE